jgi:hypothetical protein
MITIGILSLLTLAIGVSWALARRRRRNAQNQRNDIPLFTLPVSELMTIGRPSIDPGRARRTTPTGLETVALATDPPVDGRDVAPNGAPTIRTRDGAVSTLSLSPRRESGPGSVSEGEGGAAGEPFDGTSIRYWRAADGTLQFLPGRLAISSGHDAGQEIRFVRTAGPEGTRITFGRAEGAPYRHVQLREPTVSRSHARMSLEPAAPGSAGSVAGPVGGGHWRLENLSSINPVLVNGRPLGTHGGPAASVILSDGDRIEMGEVAFVFHAR